MFSLGYKIRANSRLPHSSQQQPDVGLLKMIYVIGGIDGVDLSGSLHNRNVIFISLWCILLCCG